MESKKILALRVALLIAVSEANKHKNVNDLGTCNMDTPIIFLPKWRKSDIEKAFNLTGLTPYIEGSSIHVLRACEGQGFRRTAMAEAFRDSMKEQGYQAVVEYRMD